MGKQNIYPYISINGIPIYPYISINDISIHGILFILKKKGNSDTYYNKDES